MQTDWFNQARYGMFIHWGAYSVGARGEWVANRERIPFEEYRSLFAERFHAEHYNPEEWASLAQEAGMKYAVLTTRHHDGYALWPTRQNEFHSGKIGPKRDLVGPFVRAFRKAGLRVGLYYSPANWFHPDYPGAHFRDWPSRSDWKSPAARERMTAFYSAQLRELMTEYGRIDYLWYDGCLPDDLQSRAINEEMLRLQPHLLINERNGEPSHVRICEQAIRPDKSWRLWEACMTLNENWGYHAGDCQWKSPLSVIQMLTQTAAKAGNLLLNVGPQADGSIPTEAELILRESGEWVRRNGDAIYGSDRSPFTWNGFGQVTVRASTVYLHLWNSIGRELCFAEIKNRVKSVRALESGCPVTFRQNNQRLFLTDLPERLPASIATTIAIEVDGVPETINPQTTFWIPGEPAG